MEFTHISPNSFDNKPQMCLCVYINVFTSIICFVFLFLHHELCNILVALYLVLVKAFLLPFNLLWNSLNSIYYAIRHVLEKLL